MSDRAARPSRAGAIEIVAEPIDSRRCLFTVDRPLLDGRWAYFATLEAACGSALPEHLWSTLPDLAGVLISHDELIVSLPEPAGGLSRIGSMLHDLRRVLGDRAAGTRTWRSLGQRVGSTVREHLESGRPTVADEALARMPTTAELRSRVQEVLDRDVNPVVADHGGGVAIADMIDNVVYLVMSGGCQGCGLADMTLTHGVRAAIRDAVPEIGRIVDLTNHSAGVQPYARSRSSGTRSPFSNR